MLTALEIEQFRRCISAARNHQAQRAIRLEDNRCMKFQVTYLYKVNVVIEAAHIENAVIIARNSAANEPNETCKVFAIEEIREERAA
jgi:hypothetical protein